MPSSDNKTGADRRKLQQGRRFEKLAAIFYEQQRFRILRRNWRVGHKEIDLIVEKDGLIVFVEVKSTYSSRFGHPAERVDRRKRKNLTEAARQFLVAERIEKTDLRFDVVTFVDGRLEHFPDAFSADA